MKELAYSYIELGRRILVGVSYFLASVDYRSSHPQLY